MATQLAKDEAYKLIEKMPEDSTWDDLISKIYVRQVIEQGLTDSQNCKTTDVREVRKKYDLPE